MQAFFVRFMEDSLKALPNILSAIFIVLASIILARVMCRLLTKFLKNRKADLEVANLLVQITYWSIIIAGIITAVQRFFDVTAYLAGLGIIGFTVGFALQDIMKNFASGVILLIQQPFHAGDAIEVKGFGGTILSINLRTTEMRTFDGLIVIIPNADVLSNPITNYTRAKLRRTELRVGVSYGTDPAKVRSVILDVLSSVPGFVAEPPPMVVFHTFGGATLDVSAYFWFDTDITNPLAAKDAAFELIKIALDKNGIEIPLPITTIYPQNLQK